MDHMSLQPLMEGYSEEKNGAGEHDHVSLLTRRSSMRRKQLLIGGLVLLLLLAVVGIGLGLANSKDSNNSPIADNSETMSGNFPSNGSPMKFFNQSDALGVVWYHGANSLSQMQEALDGNYMMLEGDIHLRWYGFDNQTNEPVMMHDPGDSDNTLDNWLNNILATTNKAPKLDFKSMDVVEPSLKILASKSVQHPVWVNADVVRGPGGGPPKFDSEKFLSLVNQYFPALTLSLGWTTSCCVLPYTQAMMDDMYEVVTQGTDPVKQPVTFPARAALLKDSWELFRALVLKEKRFSITVWTPSGREDWEGATQWDMIYVRNDINKSRIYYDLPGPRFQAFQRDAITAGTPLNHFSATLGEWDALGVSWAHAVNSQQELTDALQSDIMMLEADVLLRGQGTDEQTDIPIMAHPPATDSDITLEEWIEKVAPTPKGIKLDFKSVGVLEPAMKILEKHTYTQPVWLNADILSGPGAPNSTPVNSTEFKRIVNAYFPACTWSIGWTTGWNNILGDRNEVYSKEQVDEMLEYVKDVVQPITYPIRAAMVKRSWSELKRLLDTSRQSTITVWSGKTDNVDVDGLVTMRAESDPHRVFYDLPDELMAEFLNRINATLPN